ncbi:MAG: hypothetical protein CMJ18_20240 [Phycisphaeraceae bacterium]|nr:hypothetical protein [Phycisphaeraceae bacterium]
MGKEKTLGQAIDSALEKIDTEYERLRAKLTGLKEQRELLEAELSTTATALEETEGRRKSAIADALAGAGIDLNGSAVAAAAEASAPAPVRNGRMSPAQKKKYIDSLVGVLNANQGQRFSAGVLSERIGCDSKKITILLKSIKGWNAIGERFTRRYFVPESKQVKAIE